MKLPREEILEIFHQTHALLEGHFLLTSGLHSPQYFQCAKVLQYPKYLHLLSGEIAKHFEYNEIELVVSPAVGGVVVGTEVGRLLNARTIFGERQDGSMSMRRGFEIKKGERVLIVEDVVTTGGSVLEIIELVKAAGALPVGVGYIVDRSNGSVRFDAKTFPVLTMEVLTYRPDDCPLCKAGSAAVKPGSRGLK
jgi:orotate phosphoribosyltransferase